MRRGKNKMRPVPQKRIVEKLDGYMSRRDYAGAERHLLYWLNEAIAACDERGELMVRNELIGHFRKTGNREQAFRQIDEALSLIEKLGFEHTISAGTTYVNAATALNAFGENEQAIRLFEKALSIYESTSNTDPHLLGGLYNNMALVCVSLKRFDEADKLFASAIATMSNVENGELEQAMTYLNKADAIVAKRKAEAPAETEEDPLEDALCAGEVEELLDKAYELLDSPTIPRDGYYAFVCEKCASVFAYYGYFLADADLRERAEAIYERT